MIERGGAFIEAAGVPGIAKSKAVDVEMVAELVAEGAQKGSKRGDLLANGRSHPDPDEHRRGMVVPKKLGRGALPDAQGSGGQHPDAAGPDLVKVGGRGEKLRGRAANVREGVRLHGRLDGPGNSRKSPIFWQRKCFQSITADKEFAISLAWWRVGQHPEFYFAPNQRFALGVILGRRVGSRCAESKTLKKAVRWQIHGPNPGNQNAKNALTRSLFGLRLDLGPAFFCGLGNFRPAGHRHHAFLNSLGFAAGGISQGFRGRLQAA
jgi:hypothetical protein